MKLSKLSAVFVVAWLLFSLTCMSYGLTIPDKPSDYINDYAHMLSSDTVQQLDTKLRQFEQKTSNQITVVTVDSLDGQSLDQTATKLEDQWHIGTKKHSNGVILLIAKKDHKARIEVGYGLEGVLTDTLSGMIIRNELVPSFKQRRYNLGVTKTVDAIIKATQHAYKGSATKYDDSWYGLLFLVILFVFFLRSFFGSGFGGGGSSGFLGSGGGRSSNTSGGGGFSGGGGSSGGGGASGGW